MIKDELNSLKSIQMTLENAFVQKDIFWTKEIMSSAMMSLDALINRSEKKEEPLGDTPCPVCNPTGVFNYSPVQNCICAGRAWVWKLGGEE